jgi:hypothetical protein
MAIDPKAAAAAAQAAAAAAQAAAEAAAAEAAAQAATAEGTSAAPTLADSGAREVLEDTDATGAGDGQMDGSNLSSLLNRDIDMFGETRDGLAGLPDLGAVAGTSAGGITAPFDLTAGLESQQSPGITKDAIGTVFRVNIERDKAELVRTQPAEEEWVRWKTETDPPETDDGGDAGGGDAGGGDAGGDGGSTGGGSTDGGGQAPNPSPLDPVISGDPPEEEEDEHDDDVIVVQGEGSGGGSTAVAMPVPDEDGGGGRTLGGLTPIGPLTGNDILTGITGHTGTSDGGRLAPQGGDGAINPGAEGYVAGRQTDLRDAKEWYGGGVSQPGSDLEPVSGNPAMLDQGVPSVDPNTVNPSGGEGSTADSEAQASTAYSSAPGSAEAAGNGDAGGAMTADPFLPDAADGGMAVDATDAMEPMSDEGHGGGRGGEHGRDFGHDQGRGHGSSDDGDDDLPE